ncbi:MAG: hypothetical protein Q9167_001126 [Letrouitia subvulpina]
MSKNGTPAPSADQLTGDRTANLLNLLKFGTPTNSAQSPLQNQSSSSRPGYGSPDTHSVHGRGISASDLVGSFMGKSSSPPIARENVKPSVSSNHQDVLLKLLNRSAPPQPTGQQGHARQGPHDVLATQTNRQSSTTPSGHRSDSVTRHESPIRYFGGSEEAQPTPFEPQDMPNPVSVPAKSSIFTYVNPFEQLAASSPRNAKATTPTGEGKRRKIKETSTQALNENKNLSSVGNEILQSIESPNPTPLEDGRTRVEALMGIGAPTKNSETVAEALNEVGNQISREVETSLAKAEAKADEFENRTNRQEVPELAREATATDIVEEPHDISADGKKGLDKVEDDASLNEKLQSPISRAAEDIFDEAAQGDGGEFWESVDGEDPRPVSANGQTVRVYQFPLKPFVSIDIKSLNPPEIMFRDDSLTHIARLKKDFDQVDRTLATATNELIVYASPKTGGVRVIRQDDGLAKHLFPDTRDRIFNVSLANGRPSSEKMQAVLATGLSGSVYWASVYRPGEDILESGPEKETLIFPLSQSQFQNSSSAQLKTRARKCNRHPEIFAIGRGKTINIVFPLHARNSEFKYGGDRLGEGSLVDMEKYLQDRSIKISTGKAGKDFTFSEDDTMILSLDKSGRLKFWDVRELISADNGTASKLAAIDIKSPELILNTASQNDKAWPTSVLFVDKLRPYVKGTAHRYIIVGMKQNHTLQLWDLCLNKAVQELSFPHNKETDPICSVSYHPGSGIVVVGHPTRNSIYFIHLSAPKYNLPTMSQAEFVERLANKDSTLPKPEATAILSGLREYSFGATGQIRSLELVPSVGEAVKSGGGFTDTTLFELYVMHSKGVMSLGVSKKDLGWSSDNKVLHPVEAEREGYIVVKDLRELSQAMSEHPSTNGDHVTSAATNSIGARGTRKESQGATAPSAKKSSESKGGSSVPPVMSLKNEPAIEEDERAATSTTVEKAEKAEKKKKKSRRELAQVSTEATSRVSSISLVEPRNMTPQLVQDKLTPPWQTGPDTIHPTQSAANGESIDPVVSMESLDQQLRKVENAVTLEFRRVLEKELETLYRRFEDDKRVQKATTAANQDAMLRLVAATLGENVETALSRIIHTNIQQDVLPALTSMTADTVDRRLPEALTKQLNHAIPSLLKVALPEAISRGIQNPDVLRLLSEQLTAKVTSLIEREISNSLHKNIMPALESFTLNITQKVGVDVDRRVQEHLRQVDTQRRDDGLKIEQLTSLVRGLSETVQTMAAAQSEFQQEILKLQQQAIRDRRTSLSTSTQNREPTEASEKSTPPRKSPEQEAIELITSLMDAGQFEEGTIQWLQSEFQDPIFNDFLVVRCDPSYLRQLSPLINLSVGAAITTSLENHLTERLTWLEVILSTISPRDHELREVGPRIMEVLKERLESHYMSSAEINPNEPTLRQIPPLARRVREMIKYFR